nr:hypothetical protein [Pantoea agglomerans]
MNKLTAEKCRSHIARLKRYEGESLYQFPFEVEMLEAFEIALPILEQQERGEGEWIEWAGGECPISRETEVSVKFRDGETSAENHPAGSYRWYHSAQSYSRGDDIIAYRIIPERATNQNGEQ